MKRWILTVVYLALLIGIAYAAAWLFGTTVEHEMGIIALGVISAMIADWTTGGHKCKEVG